jgi:coiled-coil domain-containing protein 12
MSAPNTLSAAAQDRKARLAQLKSLKRKTPDSPTEGAAESTVPEEQDVERTYLSGRNYDVETRGPKLGFESAPTEGRETLEQQAAALALATKQEAEAEAKNDAPLDLFKLRPKKPNWDLKRELKERMQALDLRTENAIARLVRQRVESKQKAANGGGIGGVAGALEGGELVEAIRAREREEEEDERRDRELEAEVES